jgi:hypothetical protein
MDTNSHQNESRSASVVRVVIVICCGVGMLLGINAINVIVQEALADVAGWMIQFQRLLTCSGEITFPGGANQEQHEECWLLVAAYTVPCCRL